jgi:N-acetylmuramoyl-L-alanine amidase
MGVANTVSPDRARLHSSHIAEAVQTLTVIAACLTTTAARDTVCQNHKGSGMQVTNHGLVIRAGCEARKLSRIIFQLVIGIATLLYLTVSQSVAQELSVLAKLDASSASFNGTDTGIEIALPISQSVPWRTRVLAAPPRLVIDFREVDFAEVATVPIVTPHIKAVRAGIFRPGWSRLVVELDGPYAISSAEMKTGNAGVIVNVTLAQSDAAKFARLAAQPEPAEWVLPKPAIDRSPPKQEGGPIVVVLDPGHGGIDPGAERNGKSEAKLMLGFARQLKEILLREGLFKVVMTRDEDVFVPLEARISIARAAKADILISLHADALEEGEAVGAVIYTLSADASEAAAATLAERHDRDDLLAGINLVGQDDLVATVLMDMARTETAPRTARLASALEEAILSADLKMHRVPLQSAAFSVLKSPDIPSVLIELGFLSSANDMARLTDKKWREKMAGAIRDGVMIWAQEDVALQSLRLR